MVRTKQESDRRSGKLVGAVKTSNELAERKGWPWCHKESNWQVRKSCFCQLEKEQSHLSRVPDRIMVGESQVEREPHLGERGGGIRAGA